MGLCTICHEMVPLCCRFSELDPRVEDLCSLASIFLSLSPSVSLCPSYLCFESSSSKSAASKKNKVIKLVDITDIQKVSIYTLD